MHFPRLVRSCGFLVALLIGLGQLPAAIGPNVEAYAIPDATAFQPAPPSAEPAAESFSQPDPGYEAPAPASAMRVYVYVHVTAFARAWIYVYVGMEDPVNRWDPTGLDWVYKGPSVGWTWDGQWAGEERSEEWALANIGRPQYTPAFLDDKPNRISEESFAKLRKSLPLTVGSDIDSTGHYWRSKEWYTTGMAILGEYGDLMPGQGWGVGEQNHDAAMARLAASQEAFKDSDPVFAERRERTARNNERYHAYLEGQRRQKAEEQRKWRQDYAEHRRGAWEYEKRIWAAALLYWSAPAVIIAAPVAMKAGAAKVVSAGAASKAAADVLVGKATYLYVATKFRLATAVSVGSGVVTRWAQPVVDRLNLIRQLPLRERWPSLVKDTLGVGQNLWFRVQLGMSQAGITLWANDVATGGELRMALFGIGQGLTKMDSGMLPTAGEAGGYFIGRIIRWLGEVGTR